jgi:hypothetical protein
LEHEKWKKGENSCFLLKNRHFCEIVDFCHRPRKQESAKKCTFYVNLIFLIFLKNSKYPYFAQNPEKWQKGGGGGGG